MNVPDLDRMEDLTRRYARYSQGAAGLGAVLGGLAFLFQGGLLFGYGFGHFLRHACNCPIRSLWKFFLRNELPPPLWMQIELVALPLVWWAARVALHRWATRTIGEVQEQRTGFRLAWKRLDVLSGLIGGPALMIFFSLRKVLDGHPTAWTPFILGLLLLVLQPVVTWTQRRSYAAEDFGAGVSLFLAGSFTLNYGIGPSVALLVPAYLVLVIGFFFTGLWQHWHFRKVRQELAPLEVPE